MKKYELHLYLLDSLGNLWEGDQDTTRASANGDDRQGQSVASEANCVDNRLDDQCDVSDSYDVSDSASCFSDTTFFTRKR